MVDREYQTTRRYKWLCANAKSIKDMITIVRDEAILLEELQKKGVTLKDDGGCEDDYAHLVTDSIDVVREYGHLGWGYFENPDPEGLWEDEGIYTSLDENGNPEWAYDSASNKSWKPQR